MIRFKEPAELELITSYDEQTETAQCKSEVFNTGDVADAEVLETNENFRTCTIQFGDGSMAYGVPMSIFEVVEKEDLVSKEKPPFDDPPIYHESFC